MAAVSRGSARGGSGRDYVLVPLDIPISIHISVSIYVAQFISVSI